MKDSYTSRELYLVLKDKQLDEEWFDCVHFIENKGKALLQSKSYPSQYKEIDKKKLKCPNGSISKAIDLLHTIEGLKKRATCLNEHAFEMRVIRLLKLYEEMLDPILFLRPENSIKILDAKSSESEKLEWIVSLIDYYEFHAKSILDKFPEMEKIISNDYELFEHLLSGYDETIKLSKEESCVRLYNDICNARYLIEEKDYLMLSRLISHVTFYATKAGIDFPDYKIGERKGVCGYSAKHLLDAAEILFYEEGIGDPSNISRELAIILEFQNEKDKEKIRTILNEYNFPPKLNATQM